MKAYIVAVALLTLTTPALAANYATCVLDKMPGLENDTAAIAARQICLNEYVGGLAGVVAGSGRGWFSYKSGAECAYEKAKSTHSRSAAYQIRAACNRLYDEPPTPIAFDYSEAVGKPLHPWTEHDKLDEEKAAQ